MTLQERIEAAIKRVISGHAPMRIPVDETDVDIVLGECCKEIANLEQRHRAEFEACQAAERRVEVLEGLLRDVVDGKSTTPGWNQRMKAALNPTAEGKP